MYYDDYRYPGPSAHAAPTHIHGLPTDAELAVFPKLFTWGELKEIVYTGDLELLMRNKALQNRYDEWMTGIKAQYGSTENYLVQARLPWPAPSEKAPPDLVVDASPQVGSSSQPDSPTSGTSTPSSANFVRMTDLRSLNRRLRRGDVLRSPSSPSPRSPGDTFQPADLVTLAPPIETHRDEGASTVSSESTLVEDACDYLHIKDLGDDDVAYLRWDALLGMDADTFAVLPNDWPYSVPAGVKHFCVWSKIPIAHPELVSYDEDKWSKIEAEGLSGFTGITPVTGFVAKCSQCPDTGTACEHRPPKSVGRLDQHAWYSADMAYAGKEARRWAGVTYESPGGHEVGKMVAGLWDPRGWECIWFVNPPRLQSVLGFSHFHVFARRKTPEEIDACEV